MNEDEAKAIEQSKATLQEKEHPEQQLKARTVGVGMLQPHIRPGPRPNVQKHHNYTQTKVAEAPVTRKLKGKEVEMKGIPVYYVQKIDRSKKYPSHGKKRSGKVGTPSNEPGGTSEA